MAYPRVVIHLVLSLTLALCAATRAAAGETPVVVTGVTVANAPDPRADRDVPVVSKASPIPGRPLPQPAPVRAGSARARRRGSSGKRAAVYARYSSKFQHSIQDQVRECRKWCEENGFEVAEGHVFADAGVTGKKVGRVGLTAMLKAVAAGEVDVVVVFHTSRLMRRAYQARRLVEEEMEEAGVRFVSIKNGVDTANDNWRTLFGVHAMSDEMQLQATAVQVRGAHIGLLLERKVYGTLSFGYAGVPVEGQQPNLRTNRVQKRIVVSPEHAEWVRRIFAWYAQDAMSVERICRRLNREKAPLPPKVTGSRWTALAVRTVLGNERYVGRFAYGDKMSVWQNKKDYNLQVERDEPLEVRYFEDLRIVDDVTFHKAQARLAAYKGRGGRNRADGTPALRVLNGLLRCPNHDRALTVSGGKFHCPECRRSDAPHLYTAVRVEDAVRHVCRALADRVGGHPTLADDVVAAARRHAEELERGGGAARLEELERRHASLSKKITSVMNNFGDDDESRTESDQLLKALRAERAQVTAGVVAARAALANVAAVPTAAEAAAAVAAMAAVLAEAAEGGDPSDAVALREVIEALTGGRIDCHQCGEKKAKRGWLTGTFPLHLARGASGGRVADSGEVPVMTVEFRDPPPATVLAERALEMLNADVLMKDVAKELGIGRSRLSRVLGEYCRQNKVDRADGRRRRARLAQKTAAPPLHQRVAEQVMTLFRQGRLLQEIASELGVDRNVVTASVKWWHRSRGLPVPDGRTRRKELVHTMAMNRDAA